MMCGKSEVIIVILKSSFLPEEPNRRISSGYYKNDRSSSICWAGGLVRRCLVVRGWENVIMEFDISE